MKQLFKKEKLLIFLVPIIVIFGLSFLPNNSASSEAEPEAVLCTLSKEFKEWEKLSDEEKDKTIMPPMCDSEADNINYRYFAFDVRGILPTAYDGRTQGYTPKIKDQKQTGGCWFFSVISGLETYAQKKLKLTPTYSTRHVEYAVTRDFLNGEINENGYQRTLGEGGNHTMSSNYLINGYGPIAEAEMPFENNEDMIELSEIQNKKVLLDVDNIVLETGRTGEGCSESQNDQIKRYILENGAVMIATYITTSTNYYNADTAAYYYNGSSGANHSVSIIGWDDNYSKDNFSVKNRPTSDGAWIVQNSYGADFGENGYYYISYEDAHTCNYYMVIDSADTEFEDNSYILDVLGYNSYMGYASTNGDYTTAYAMNVFSKDSGKSELLKEVTFGSNGTGTYKIYYKKGNAGTHIISSMTEIGSGVLNYAGYVTHKFDEPILLEEDVTDFSIAIYYDMDTSTRPIPVSVGSVYKYQYITIGERQSYISYNGYTWTDLSTRSYPTIASIKAFTDDVSYKLSLDDYSVMYDNDVNIQITTTSKNIDNSKLRVVMKNSKGVEVKPSKISYTNANNNLKYIDLTLSSSVVMDTYTIDVYYDNVHMDGISVILDNKVTSNKYTIDQNNLIIYLSPKTSVATFKSNITSRSNTIYNGNNIVTSGYITTGMMIDNYLIIIEGDVTGDGLVKMNDVMKISKYIIENVGMSERKYQLAADVTNDSSIKMNDVMKICKYIIEGDEL